MERKAGSDFVEKLFAERFGLLCNPAPVVVRNFLMKDCTAKGIYQQLWNPGSLNISWLTTEVALPSELAGYRGFSAIGGDGRESDVVIALAGDGGVKNQALVCRSPGAGGGSTSWQVSDEVAARKIPNNFEMQILLLSHPCISSKIPQEAYLVLIAADQGIDRIMRMIDPVKTVSGSHNGHFSRRAALAWQQGLPFEYILGLDSPGLHQSGTVWSRMFRKRNRS